MTELSAAELAARAARALGAAGALEGRPRCAFFVPGRIEVLGKHTDYAGGRSLLAALERGIVAVGVARSDDLVGITDAGTGERLTFPLSSELEARGGWANYPMTVARRMARDFGGPTTGAEIAFASDLPPAAGMSSSTALIVATFLVLSTLNELAESPAYREAVPDEESLGEYLAAVEAGRGFAGLAADRGVGTHGGSEDHTAILCARPGELVRYSFAPIRFECSVPLPEGYTFALASSGVVAEKGGAARERYNEASARARRVAELWNAATGRSDAHIAAALRSSPDAAERLREVVRGADAPLIDRLEQFIAESEEIVPAATDALAVGRLEEAGALVDRSQALAERLLGNQVEETVELARGARELGAVAASAFGAGFGGSVWALVERARAEELLSRWRERYLLRFPERGADAAFFLSGAGPAVRRVL